MTFECDHPPEARTRRIVSTSALPRGAGPGGHRRGRPGPDRRRRGPLPPRPRRARGPGRRPRGDAGPVRGVRGRRLRGHGRPRAPGLPRGGAHHRPPRPRAGAGLRGAGRLGDRPRGRGPGPGRGPAGAPGRRCRAGGRPAPAAHGGAGVDRPAVRPGPLGARDGAARRRSVRPGPRGRAVRADHLGRRRGRRAGPRRLGTVRLRPGGLGPAGPGAAGDREAAGRRTGLGGGRQRLLRPAGPRLVDGIEALAAILHGDQEPDPVLARRLR